VNRYSPVPAVPARPSLLAVIAVLLALALAACSPDPAPSGPVAGQPTPAGPIATPVAVATPVPAPTAVATALPTAVPTPAPSPTPAVDYQGMKVNELGTIPILQYHIIGDEDGRWERSAESFRRDLEKLYAAGYRPIALADLLDNRIDLPAGTSPVIFSFDDSSPGQFRYIERDGQLIIDPDSAVGMLEEFHARHPDWELRGVFSVLPEAEQPHKLFGQPEYEEKKLQYLVERGFELANHSWWHQRLDIVDDEEVQRQLAFAVRDIEKRVPGYRMRYLTLPLGMWPENRRLAFSGSFEGETYENVAILLVASDPVPSPYSVDFDPFALQRVQVFDDSLDRWIAYLEKHPEEKYVSDGDPNTISYPRELESLLDPNRTQGKETRPY
jgi:peptidoglycan/xylan/chitin deacetylase (PgdA/CDA1 family)